VKEIEESHIYMVSPAMHDWVAGQWWWNCYHGKMVVDSFVRIQWTMMVELLSRKNGSGFLCSYPGFLA